MNITKIAVGIDFSPESDSAIQHAVNIARHAGAEIVLVHVGAILDHSLIASESVHPSIKEWETVVHQALAEDRRRLEELRERLLGQGVEISHVIRDGFADTALAETASEIGADLLIVGTHGRSGLRRFFLGSISERVVRLSHTNVMVARALSDAPAGYRRILVPTDFSAPAARALELAFDVAGPGASIEVVHFWQVPVTASTPYAPFKAAEDALTTVREAMAEAAEQSGQRLLESYRRSGVDLTYHAVEASPAHGIQDRLAAGNYDLVAVGSHGRRGIRRLLLGSVAELTVRHAPCSALVAHGGPEAPSSAQIGA
ncbi:MAG TPA: universal stress protein [Haliangium sp.]|nr:universal stress protein [Haliangium sp.]